MTVIGSKAADMLMLATTVAAVVLNPYWAAPDALLPVMRTKRMANASPCLF